MTGKTDAAKTFYATRNFKDTGTGRSFEGGKPIEADPGEIGNYEAAGLASDKKPETSKADASAS
jgi:hypothetical protein